MLELHVPNFEGWDSTKEEFVNVKSQDVTLEHSLLSISKWESKWHISFFDTNDKSTEQIVDYIRCMSVSKTISDDILFVISRSQELISKIKDYIEDPMTATTIRNTDPNSHNKRQVITSELVYYKMIAYGIPFECQKWHINRLLMLISVCDINNQPQKKMSKKEIMASNAELNRLRRNKLGSKG